MTVSQRDKVEKDLAGVISGELSTLLGSAEKMMLQGPLNSKAVFALSRRLAERMIANETLLERVAELALPKKKGWLTTEEAAKRSGFSRPFIAALLDSDFFEGKVSRTEKGHRRVDASDFQHWMEKSRRPANLPTTLSEARSGPRDDEPARLVETDSEKQKRKSARKSALAAARELGLG